MNEALQQSLYDKLSREQDKYRYWLKGQPPEKILHHSDEYTVREDILMSMEELTLSEAETRALLLSPSPMAILYDKFSDLETGYMDTIRDSIEDTAKDEAKKLRDLPVYPYPSDHAREQGELDVYRASFRANVSCKDAIEAAIRDNYHDNRLDTAAVGQVAEQFGQERMLYVLAATVRHFDYDGRIAQDNKRWANTIPAYQNGDGMDSDRSVQFVVSSHPGLTDLFLTQARHEQRLRQPLTADEIKTEAARLLGKLQEPVQPNSPGGTHFMAEVSRDSMERAGGKDTAALQKLLPFSTLALTTLKDRRGVFAVISKEDRTQPLRSRKPSVRSKLQQAAETQRPPLQRAGSRSADMAKQKRDVLLKVRVTPEERELIRQKMALLGTDNMAAYMRKMAIDGYVVKLDLPELRKLVSLLRYSSNNLNQLARRVHETGRVYAADMDDILQNQERIWQAASGILSHLAAIR